jgi:hypothetical protein
LTLGQVQVGIRKVAKMKRLDNPGGYLISRLRQGLWADAEAERDRSGLFYQPQCDHRWQAVDGDGRLLQCDRCGWFRAEGAEL